jgi:HD-GYP domain-containing protein (c-di-GMP phosphodiesterase class II)
MAMISENEKLETLRCLGIELNQVHDLDILMEHVLSQARRFSNADAGSVYIRKGNDLHFSYTQNETLQRKLGKGQKLIYSTFSIPIDETSIAGYVAGTGISKRIADVYHLDSCLPYSFGKQFDQKTGYRTTSMLTLPLKTARGDTLGILQIINARDESGKTVSFSEKDEQMMFHFASIASVALERAQMMRSLFLKMIQMAELRDPGETGAHVNRVGAFSAEIYEKWAEKRELPKKEIDKQRDILRMAAMLHDVGKVAISDLILKKPERLDRHEYEIMKQHTILGARLFRERQSDFDKAAFEVTLNHHERWDGKGYPGYVDILAATALPGGPQVKSPAAGKKGTDIPLFARIVALADVFDALASKRVYKPPWDERTVLKALQSQSGRHFDPEIVTVFLSVYESIKAIQNRYTDDFEEVRDDSKKAPEPG